jgi:hypothetical protein
MLFKLIFSKISDSKTKKPINSYGPAFSVEAFFKNACLNEESRNIDCDD